MLFVLISSEEFHPFKDIQQLASYYFRIKISDWDEQEDEAEQKKKLADLRKRMRGESPEVKNLLRHSFFASLQTPPLNDDNPISPFLKRTRLKAKTPIVSSKGIEEEESEEEEEEEDLKKTPKRKGNRLRVFSPVRRKKISSETFMTPLAPKTKRRRRKE